MYFCFIAICYYLIIIFKCLVGEPLWSCCWAGDNTHTLVAGGQMGSLFYMDRRFMKLYNSEQSRKLACVSLIPLPPSGTRSFVQGGFLKTRMDYLSVFEHEPGVEPSIYRETELPLRALWACSSYDSQSNLILSTAKPTGLNKSVRHIVSRIRNVNAEGPIVSPVATFYGQSLQFFYKVLFVIIIHNIFNYASNTFRWR